MLTLDFEIKIAIQCYRRKLLNSVKPRIDIIKSYGQDFHKYQQQQQFKIHDWPSKHVVRIQHLSICRVGLNEKSSQIRIGRSVKFIFYSFIHFVVISSINIVNWHEMGIIGLVKTRLIN